MNKKQSLSQELKREIDNIVSKFNRSFLKEQGSIYIPRYKGNYLYLYRNREDGNFSPICRLRYTGDMNKWEFTLYRHSKGCYDPEIKVFAGVEYLDGTIQGAMKAGLKFYKIVKK